MKKYLPILSSSLLLIIITPKGFGNEVKSTDKTFKDINHLNTCEASNNKSSNPEFRITQKVQQETELNNEQILKNISQLPLMFQKNLGQWQKEILYIASTQTVKVAFKKDGISFYTCRELKEDDKNNSDHNKDDNEDNEQGQKEIYESLTWNVNFKGMSSQTMVNTEGEAAGVINYLLGNDSSKWYRNIPECKVINYKEIYDYIDLRYYGLENYKLEYDFVVKPGGNILNINMELDGAGELEINNKGELIITTPWGKVAEAKPFSYQIINGIKKEIDIRYFIINDHTFGFKTYGSYDSNYDLIIDPKQLVWSTLTKGNGTTHYTQDLKIDANRNSYLTGWTDNNFDITPGVKQATFGGGTYDAWVCKFNRTGTSLIYCTYLGGSNDERGLGIAVSSTGIAYITGITKSTNFPVASAVSSTLKGSADIFVSALNTTGTNFIYSTYYGGGGSDEGHAICVNSSNEVYVTGLGKKNSTPFPTTAGVVQPSGDGSADAFILKLTSTGSTAFCTLLGSGGGNTDQGNGIFVSSTGEIYLTGDTQGSFPVTAGAYQVASGGGVDAFISKLDANATTLLYSTYLGGTGDDYGWGIFVQNNYAYVAGTAGSGFPTTSGAFQTTFGGGTYDAFAAKLNTTGSALIYSTYLGGSLDEGGIHTDYKGNDIYVNYSGQAYIAGITASSDFPVINGYDMTYNGNDDGFLSLLNATGTGLLCSTYFGGEKDDYKRLSIDLDLTGTTDTLYAAITTHSNTPYDATTGSYPIAETQGSVYSKVHVNSGEDEVGIFKMYSCVLSLPVKLISFEGINEGNHNLLKWITSEEINNDYFSIERSSDGINFTSIGTVNGAGNSKSLTHYTYLDSKSNDERTYYRLKQIDIDGNVNYSNVVEINGIYHEKPLDLKVTSSVSDQIIYSICCTKKGDAKVEVIDMSGKVIMNTNIHVNEGFNKMILDSKSLASGMYILIFTSDYGFVKTKFVK